MGEDVEAFTSVTRAARIVCRINWCGSFAPNIVGCARTPGTRIVIVRLSSREDILWAHEYGHSKGLPHRSDPLAVMNPTLLATARGVNQGEVNAYRSLSLLKAVGPWVADTMAAPGQQLPIEDFIKQQHPHGVPYDEAKAYGEAVIPTLEKMLKDQSLIEYWPNAVIVLGINGKKSTFSTLWKHLERKGQGVLAQGDYDSRIYALPAMGYLANKLGPNDSKDIIKYLRKGIDPKTWQGYKLKWRSPTHANPTEQAVIDDLVGQSTLGLALSGQKEAADALTETSRTVGAERSRGFLNSAAAANRYIEANGLSKYYQVAPALDTARTSSTPAVGEGLVTGPVALQPMTQDICLGSPVPAGWIIVDTRWVATSCNGGSSSRENVATIDQYSNKPVGTQMDVCTGQVVPIGWAQVNTKWVATRCHEGGPFNPNVMTIRRLPEGNQTSTID